MNTEIERLKEASEFVDRLRDEFLRMNTEELERDLLIGQVNVLKRDVVGYHGREILELVQNADDAFQKLKDRMSMDGEADRTGELNVEITYKGDLLTISNNGEPFDKAGIKAVVQGNNSSKKSGKFIGNKGTGFRSVLNWASAVRLYSGPYAVGFSKTYADQEFEKIKDNPQIAKQLKDMPDLYIPMLAVPYNLDEVRNDGKTTVEIDIDPEKVKDDFSVTKQLNDFDLRILLFLPNLSKMTIRTEDAVIEYERILDHNVAKLVKRVNGEVAVSENYRLSRKDDEIEGVKPSTPKRDADTTNKIQMAVAVPLSSDAKISNLYSYFPLFDTGTPFDCVMHATYNLGDQRNNLVYNEVNKQVLKKQFDFLFEIAEDIARSDPSTAQRILLPKFYHDDFTSVFPSAIAKFGLDEYYFERISQLRIFQTVKGNLLSLNDAPKWIPSGYPSCFKGDAFENLLKNDSNNDKLISLIAQRNSIHTSFDSNELCDAINRESSSWSLEDRVETFIWWNDLAKRSEVHELPYLLEMETGEWLGYGEECFLWEGDFDSINLPQWVQIPALKREYQQILIRQIEPRVERRILDDNKKESVIRTISHPMVVPVVVFKYRDRSHVLSVVNQSVDSYEKSVDFIKWLWDNRSVIEAPKEIVDSKLKLRFPSSAHYWVTPDLLYFGKPYGNTLSDRLFPVDCYEFPECDRFGVDEQHKDEFRKYISTFGVLNYPRIETMDIKSPIKWYDSRMKKKIWDAGVLVNTRSKCIDSCLYRLPYIKNLETILEGLSTAEVIEWILNDKDLRKCLSNPECSKDLEAVISYQGDNQRQMHSWNSNIDNYILATFNNAKWILLNGNKYAPLEVLNGYMSRINYKYNAYCPVLGSEHIAALSASVQNFSSDQVYEVMSMFDLPKQVTDLSSNSFYGLLLDLQNQGVMNNGDNMQIRAIYHLLEQVGFNRKFEDSENRSRFFEDGKILVMYQGQLMFYKANESYLPSPKIINKKIIPIVEKSPRTRNDSFIEVFHCRRYDKKYEIIERSAVASSLDTGFQSYFLDFHRYARAYADRNVKIKDNINKMSVTVVKSIDVNHDGNVQTISDDYTILKVHDYKWYIVIGGDCYETNQLSECIENIFANIADTPGFDGSKLGELFRASDVETRNFLIKKEFGSLDVLNEDTSVNYIKENFVQVLKNMGCDNPSSYKDIDFDDFTSDENTEHLIRFFNKMKITVDEFRDAGFSCYMRIRDYWKRQLQKHAEAARMQYKDYLYGLAKSDPTLQDCFIARCDAFVNHYKTCEIPNSAAFDPIEKLKSDFGDWTKYSSPVNAESEYSKNYSRMNPENLFADTISNDSSAKTMIYFAREEEFKRWLLEQGSSSADAVQESALDICSVYSDANQLTFYDIGYSTAKLSKSQDKMSSSSHMVATKEALAKESDSRKRKGNIGELLVYKYLCAQYGKDNVFPVSEAFSQLKIISPGLERPGGYDLSYIHDGKEYFVEVKTSESNRFFISPAELQFAMEHPDNYIIYHVFDTNRECPKFHTIAPKFWNDERYHRNDIVEKIEFTF